MKLYEKIVIILVVISFFLQFLGGEYTWIFFQIATWILALSYFFAGVWILNPNRKNRKFTLSIIAGISFGVSIISILHFIRFNSSDIYFFFPILNGLLCIGLAIYLFANRRINKKVQVKGIFKRSVTILLITSFFIYTPNTFVPYRKLIKAINCGDVYLTHNILMHEYADEYVKALKRGDCESAIGYSLKAKEAGKVWLKIEHMTDSLLNDNDKYALSGIYTIIYEAYKCKANKEYDNKQFENALQNYRTANKYLSYWKDTIQSWKVEKVWSLNNIAQCYQNLHEYEIADSIFVEAIIYYEKEIGEKDYTLAILFQNLAYSLSETAEYGYSNTSFYAAIGILQQDTLDDKNRKKLAGNFNGIAKNYLQQDSIYKALSFLTMAERFANKNESIYCYTMLNKGVCFYKLNGYLKADSSLRTCLQCYESRSETQKQNFASANIVFAQINMVLAKYDEAKKHIDIALKIIEKNYGASCSQYADYLKTLAYLNKIIGNYSTSYTQYRNVVEIYTREDNGSTTLANVLSDLANLELTLSNFESAKQLSEKSIFIASKNISLIYPSTTNFLNNAAYVSYCLGDYKSADNLYNKVISINNNYNLQHSLTTATALNGLGLIEFEKKNYKKAHSHFQQSLDICKKCLPYNTPLIANVLLNWGILCIYDNRLSEAEEKMNRAFEIDKQFFTSEHDVFADILVAQGDLAKKKGQNNVAEENYEKALNIYKKKFADKHWKIIETEKKIKK